MTQILLTIQDPGPSVDLQVTDVEQTQLIQIESAPDVILNVENGAGPRGINGASAYDVAVTAGFVGTEAEWLDQMADGSDAATAAVLATPRSIALIGDVTGSTLFDGSGDVTITATVANDSHFLSTASISDISTTGKADGALLQYSSVSEKYEPKTSLVNSNLTITGGSF